MLSTLDQATLLQASGAFIFAFERNSFAHVLIYITGNEKKKQPNVFLFQNLSRELELGRSEICRIDERSESPIRARRLLFQK